MTLATIRLQIWFRFRRKRKNLSSELDLVEAQARAEAERSRLPRQTIIFRKLRPEQPEQTNAIAKNSKNLVFAKKLQNFGLGQRIWKHLNSKNDRRSFSAMKFSIGDISIFPASIQWTIYKLVFSSLWIQVFLKSFVVIRIVKFKPWTLVFTF